MVSLGQHTSVIPTLVYVRDDDEMLIGEAAARRGVTDPARLAREFKRRTGDSAPLILGSSPYSAERLTAAVLRLRRRHRLEPRRRPARPGRAHLPGQLGPVQGRGAPGRRQAGRDPRRRPDHRTPRRGRAVRLHRAGRQRRRDRRLRPRGRHLRRRRPPQAGRRLGAARATPRASSTSAASTSTKPSSTTCATRSGPRSTSLDQNDPAVRTAVTRLAGDCVAAKEALSSDAEATIPVILPGLQSEIRLTRGEFEGMIRPTVRDSVDALRRAITSAGVTPNDLRAVLLVGGSSRIPLVSEMVSTSLGRPVAVDAHPKHAVALGAARMVAAFGPATPAPAPAAATSAGPAAAVGAAAGPARSREPRRTAVGTHRHGRDRWRRRTAASRRRQRQGRRRHRSVRRTAGQAPQAQARVDPARRARDRRPRPRGRCGDHRHLGRRRQLVGVDDVHHRRHRHDRLDAGGHEVHVAVGPLRVHHRHHPRQEHRDLRRRLHGEGLHPHHLHAGREGFSRATTTCTSSTTRSAPTTPAPTHPHRGSGRCGTRTPATASSCSTSSTPSTRTATVGSAPSSCASSSPTRTTASSRAAATARPLPKIG